MKLVALPFEVPAERKISELRVTDFYPRVFRKLPKRIKFLLPITAHSANITYTNF